MAAALSTGACQSKEQRARLHPPSSSAPLPCAAPGSSPLPSHPCHDCSEGEAEGGGGPSAGAAAAFAAASAVAALPGGWVSLAKSCSGGRGPAGWCSGLDGWLPAGVASRAGAAAALGAAAGGGAAAPQPSTPGRRAAAGVAALPDVLVVMLPSGLARSKYVEGAGPFWGHALAGEVGALVGSAPPSSHHASPVHQQRLRRQRNPTWVSAARGGVTDAPLHEAGWAWAVPSTGCSKHDARRTSPRPAWAAEFRHLNANRPACWRARAAL